MKNSKVTLFVLALITVAMASTLLLGCGEATTTETGAAGDQAEAVVEEFSADEELAITEESEEAAEQEINEANAEEKLTALEKEIEADQE